MLEVPEVTYLLTGTDCCSPGNAVNTQQQSLTIELSLTTVVSQANGNPMKKLFPVHLPACPGHYDVHPFVVATMMMIHPFVAATMMMIHPFVTVCWGLSIHVLLSSTGHEDQTG